MAGALAEEMSDEERERLKALKEVEGEQKEDDG